MQDYGAGASLEIAGGPLGACVPFTAACVPEVDIAGGRLVVVLPDEVGAAGCGAHDLARLRPDPVPRDVPGAAGQSLAGRALRDGRWSLEAVNIRDFATDRHRSVDDTPFGGGAGMVLRPDVVDAAHRVASPIERPLIYLTPRGRAADPARCARARRRPRPDAAVRPLRGRRPAGDRGARRCEEVSIGDYVLSGGELAGAGAAGCLRAAAARGDGRGRERGRGKLLRTACWNTRTTPARPNGRGARCPTCCCPATTPRWPRWRRAEAERITRERRPDLWAAHTPIAQRRWQPAGRA